MHYLLCSLLSVVKMWIVLLSSFAAVLLVGVCANDGKSLLIKKVNKKRVHKKHQNNVYSAVIRLT